MSSRPIGIMQGRLSPAIGRPQCVPRDWVAEFGMAARLGLASIEWLLTAADFESNPIWTDDGIGEMARVSAESGVAVTSLNADAFIAYRLVRTTSHQRQESAAKLRRLIERAARAGIEQVSVPVLEESAIGSAEDAAELLSALADPLRAASDVGVRLMLESDLDAGSAAALVDRADGQIGVCYDTGNAAAAGADGAADLHTLGERVWSVHIKDRPRGGATVPLGDGDVAFQRLFMALDAIGFDGPLILETPRGDDPPAAAQRNLAFVRHHLEACERALPRP